MLHILIIDKSLHNLRRIFTGDQYIHIADSLLAAAIAADGFNLFDTLSLFQILKQWLSDLFHDWEQVPGSSLPVPPINCFQDLLLGFVAKTR